MMSCQHIHKTEFPASHRPGGQFAARQISQYTPPGARLEHELHPACLVSPSATHLPILINPNLAPTAPTRQTPLLAESGARGHGLTLAEIDDLVDALSVQAEMIDPTPSEEPDLCDVDDQPALGVLLAAPNTSGASYVITGDKDLLALAGRYPIVVPATFWATHAGL